LAGSVFGSFSGSLFGISNTGSSITAKVAFFFGFILHLTFFPLFSS